MLPIEGAIPLALPHTSVEVRPLSPKADISGVGSFEQVLSNVAADANRALNTADDAGKAFAAGTRDDIHGTMLALSKADIELRFVGNVRNRVIDAFYELWRMQI
jgi:flagellar hook-basal body complex protein FliE